MNITQKWDGPAKVLCRETHNICLSFIQDLVHKHFGTFGQGVLEKNVQ
jgi:hypothetical protein